jgi:hypothetical protein
MPEKLERCVSDVKGQKGVDSAWAICTDALKELQEADHPYEAPYKESLNPQDRLDKTNYQPTTPPDPFDKLDEVQNEFGTLDPSPSDIGHRDPTKTLDPEPKHDGHRDPTKTLDPNPLDKIEQEAVSIGGGLSAQSVGGKKHQEGGPGSGQKKGPALPQSAVTPMGRGKTSSSATRVNETMCECDSFNILHEALMQEASEGKDDTEWITVKGRHIPIKKGESKDEVVKSFLAGKGKGGGEKKTTGSGVSAQSEKELISSIKGGSKDWHDWYRKESNEKEYAEIEKRNQAIPKPKRPEGAGGTIFQDDPNAISKYETKIKYLEDVGDYWKKVTKFPARDHKTPGQLGDAKWYEMSNNSQNLNTVRKKLAKVKERKESGTTLERKVTYKHGKPRFYYKENPKEGTSETISSDRIFDNVLNALRKETK